MAGATAVGIGVSPIFDISMMGSGGFPPPFGMGILQEGSLVFFIMTEEMDFILQQS